MRYFLLNIYIYIYIFSELLSPVGSPLSSYSETEKQQIVVKTEPSDVTTTKTQRRKRGPKPPVKYRGRNTGSFKQLGYVVGGGGVGGHIFSTSVFLMNISRK